jgi:FAD/FMN-containing dehydrogenase/Fe-S oxidoreductase
VKPPLQEFAAELARQIEGEVRFDTASRVLYSTDASLYQVMPVGVVLPRHVGDVAVAVRLAAKHRVPLLPRGSGTSLGGQTVGEALVLDCSRFMNRILAVDSGAAQASVQPGVILDELNAALRPHRLKFAPDVATSNRASIGGMMGNNSSGAHSLIYGKTVDHVLTQSVVLADGSETRFGEVDEAEWNRIASGTGLEASVYRNVGRIVRENAEEIDRRFPRIMRRVGGYNLDEFVRHGRRSLAMLTVGSEGTLAVVTEATINLVPLPAATGLLVAHFHDLIEALEATPACLELQPAAVELTDRTILSLSRGNAALAAAAHFLRGDPEAILVTEFYGGDEAEVRDRVAELADRLQTRGFGYAWVPVLPAPLQKQVWDLRKAGLGLLMGMKGDVKPVGFVEDTAVVPEHLADYIRRFRALLQEHGCEASYYAHASVGCLHVRPLLNLKLAEDVRRMRSIAEEVSSLVLEYGGAMSAEHGDGLVRSEFQEKMFGQRLYAAFQEVKAAFDPQWLMNPGKIVRAPRMDEQLRHGPQYQTIQLETHFDFSRDGGFARAVELCSGVGACRKKLEGTMCPSYRATLEEKHSTRGRANLLRAALSGVLPPEELAGQIVHDALDLCLECKACKTECPSNVDMAKLKYEFLARYRAAHGSPLRARLFAGVAAAGRWGSRLAPAANRLQALAPSRWLLDRLLGIDRRRALPAYARRTFRDWFRAHEPPAGAGRRGAVLFLADTFTNYNEPENGIAAVRLLEAFGYRVEVPDLRCCGRPMISKGFLQEAKELARDNLARLAGPIAKGIPLLGCEPSCLSTYRDDCVDLVGGEAARQVAGRTYLVEQFLGERHGNDGAAHFAEQAPRRVLLHGHCHQKALFGTAGALAALRMVPGWSVEEIPSGCCGMAGSFGYEKEHYEISMQIGELSLFPRVRAASPETLLLAAGTSCRHQVRDATGRQAVHPVVALAEALRAETSPNGDGAKELARGERLEGTSAQTQAASKFR